MKIKVYYHNDPDGIVSAAIVKKYYKDDEVEMVKCDYGADIDVTIDNEVERVVVVDFSFDKEIMDNFQREYANAFIWIDHHQSAMDRNPELWKTAVGIRRIDRAGCGLCWEYFFPDDKEPKLVTYVEDLDLWKWEHTEFSKPFNQVFFIKHKVPDETVVNLLHDNETITQYIVEGDVMINMQHSQVKKSYRAGKNIVWQGHKTRIVNTDHNQSQVGEYCYKEKNYQIALMWSQRGDKIIVGLRSNTIDVGSIAKSFGGGGHKFASGFETNLITIMEWLNNETD